MVSKENNQILQDVVVTFTTFFLNLHKIEYNNSHASFKDSYPTCKLEVKTFGTLYTLSNTSLLKYMQPRGNTQI